MAEEDRKKMKALETGCKPKQIIDELAEGLLKHYGELKIVNGELKTTSSTLNSPLSILNSYAVYQHLMDYWADVMQDDVYQVAAPLDQGGGWQAETYRVLVKDKKGKEKDKGWACDLVPKGLIVARYFAGQQSAIDQLEAEQEAVAAEQTELEEEHGGEEGAFGELDKINKTSVSAQLKQLKIEKGELKMDEEELSILNSQLSILNSRQSCTEKMAKLRKKIKTAEANLDSLCHAKYPELTETEVRTLVVDEKWLATLDGAIHGELDRISQTLTGRVKELAERYDTPLPELSLQVDEWQAKVNGHLEQMGFGERAQ